MLAGFWERIGGSIPQSWRRALFVGIASYALCWGYALWRMPAVAADHPVRREEKFSTAWISFFKQPGIAAIVGFFLFYRFAESMLTKISGLFLLDPRTAGGLGFDPVQVGAILGNVGIISLVAGGFLGGVLISRRGLAACLFPMAITMNLPNLLYLWAARVLPGVGPMYAITALEQFSYGFGMAPYLVYAMEISRRSRFQTSHYAITAALMSLGAMIAGAMSGFLQAKLGYFGIFAVICASAIPGMLLLGFIPHVKAERRRDELVPTGLD